MYSMEFQQRRIQSSIKDYLVWGLWMGDHDLCAEVFFCNILKIISNQCLDSEAHILTSIFPEVMLSN